MKSIIIAIVLLLSGCASTSDPDLLKGELYHSKHFTKNNNRVEHKIRLKDKEFYSFSIYFK